MIHWHEAPQSSGSALKLFARGISAAFGFADAAKKVVGSMTHQYNGAENLREPKPRNLCIGCASERDEERTPV
jgi:hypothetical protein